ncbi:MAG: hypothetical protein WBA05_09145 [Gordonia sp. (in: high G+C Gram-positive bacteria)]|uniref:hypothetical protein n=1 Tax=Gordonia TaxID=2053 RepID=UPI0032678B02
MTRTMKLAATALLGCSIALAATACGSENNASSSSDAAASAGVTAPANSSIPVVGGPKPKPQAPNHSAPESTSPSGAPTCGATKGPDGALQIHIVAGDLPCDTAQTIAREYGPLIATGAPQTVSGWDCRPSTVVGELSRCSRGSQAFALTP